MATEHIKLKQINQELQMTTNLVIAQITISRLVDKRSVLQSQLDALTLIGPQDLQKSIQIGVLEMGIQMCGEEIMVWEQKVCECESGGAMHKPNNTMEHYFDLCDQFIKVTDQNKQYITEELQRQEESLAKLNSLSATNAMNLLDTQPDNQKEAFPVSLFEAEYTQLHMKN